MAWSIVGHWSYSGDPGASDRDHVRYLIGDVDDKDPLVNDEAIQFSIDNRKDVYAAAAEVARSIAARCAREVASSVNVAGVGQDVSRQLQTRQQQFEKIAMQLEKRSGKQVKPYMGGMRISDKETDQDDTDLVGPTFARGDWDNA